MEESRRNTPDTRVAGDIRKGPHTIRILDVQGREAASMRGFGRKQYPMPEALDQTELYILEVKADRGVSLRGFFRP